MKYGFNKGTSSPVKLYFLVHATVCTKNRGKENEKEIHIGVDPGFGNDYHSMFTKGTRACTTRS